MGCDMMVCTCTKDLRCFECDSKDWLKRDKENWAECPLCKKERIQLRENKEKGHWFCGPCGIRFKRDGSYIHSVIYLDMGKEEVFSSDADLGRLDVVTERDYKYPDRIIYQGYEGE